MAPDKKAAVLAVVETLHYRPNVRAQELARGRSYAIGVLTQDISNAFFGSILKGIEQGLGGSRFHPLVASGWDREKVRQALDLFLAYRVDLLVAVGGQIPEDELLRVTERVPLIVVGQRVRGLEDHCVRVENFKGGFEATRHLLGLGHRRIAHITGLPDHPDSIDRREGYARALRDAGIALDPRLIVEGDFEEGSGLRGVETLLSRRIAFTALFTGNDQMAYGALLGLSRRGRQVPADVSIVGFDDQRGSAFTTPPLTTIRQPTLEMGVAAAQALLRLDRNEPLALPVLSTQLVVRNSTAPPPSRSRAQGKERARATAKPKGRRRSSSSG